MSVKIYEVGGSMRDELLGLQNKDQDFVLVCDGGWSEVLRWVEDFLDEIFLVKDEFLTIRGKKNGEVFDFVMARRDGGYSDGRRPDEVEPGTLLEDLARRDFTCNAIAREVGTNDLIDPFGGINDLQVKVLKTVGDPIHRMMEDHLRILRALRFCLTKNLHLSRPLQSAIHSHDWTGALKSIPVERRMEELKKMFRHNTVETIRSLSILPSALRHEIMDGMWLLPTNRS